MNNVTVSIVQVNYSWTLIVNARRGRQMELQNVNASEFSNVHGATRMRIKANALQRMAKTAFLTTLASLILHAAPVAASPKVTSFTPLTGPVGSTITI
ncbi:MAG TPA: hypothetical protein VFG71_08075, partial [Nitrospiraceae bacterium]|nr:hypothetical protein [Nitrospiraceae bacterium]